MTRRWRMVREKRDLCPATAHDTAYAYKRYKCRCKRAQDDYRLTRSLYLAVNREEINARARERARLRIRATGREPLGQGGPTYDDMMSLADWGIAEWMVHNGPKDGVRQYDRWLALDMLLRRNAKLPPWERWSQQRMADQVGVSVKTVGRFVAWWRKQNSGGTAVP